jgi:hypothetical protein
MAAPLTTAERTTLSLLLRSLSGDVVAIDTLFGVTGGTLPPNTAERASQQNLLKALAGHQSGIDALFGLTPDGSGYLSTAERSNMDNLLRALSGDPTALDALANGVGYNLFNEPQALAIHEPSSGLANLATAGVWGALSAVGSAVPIGGSFDGLPAYQIAAKTGTTGYLKSALSGQWKQPVHMVIVCRWGAAATINTSIVASATAGGAANLVWWSGTQIAINGGAVQVTTTPAAFHVYEIYYHSNFTFISIDGGAYVKINGGVGGDWAGLILGASTAGANPTDGDVLGVYLLEGVPTLTYRQAIRNRLKANFPTILAAVPSTVQAMFSLDTVTPSALFDPTTADGVVIGGQSNASNFGTDNASAAWAAGTFLLGNDNVWKVGGDPAVAFQYDSATNQTDTVSLDPVSSRGAFAGALVNAMRAASGRNTVCIAGPISASSVVVGAASNPQLDWNRNIPRGNNQRNSLYWSLVYRIREAVRWGITIRKIVWYSGETEATNPNPAIRAAFPAQLIALLRNLCADAGIPFPPDHPGDTTCKIVVVRIAPNADPNSTDFRNNVMPTIPGLVGNVNIVMVDAPNGPFSDGIHLLSAPLDTLGALAAAA